MGSPPSVASQREHFITAVVPAVSQVAGTSGVTSTLKSWFSAGISSVFVSSQTVQVKVFNARGRAGGGGGLNARVPTVAGGGDGFGLGSRRCT